MAGKPRFPLTHVDATNKIIREAKKINGLLRRKNGNPASLGSVGVGFTGTNGLNGDNGNPVTTPINCDDPANKCYVDALIAQLQAQLDNLAAANSLITPSTIVEKITESVRIGALTEYFTFLIESFSGVDPFDHTNKSIFEILTCEGDPVFDEYSSFIVSPGIDIGHAIEVLDPVVTTLDLFDSTEFTGHNGDSITVNNVTPILTPYFGSLTLTIQVGGVTQGTVVANSDGSFSKTFTLTGAPIGVTQITISDGTHIAREAFVVL